MSTQKKNPFRWQKIQETVADVSRISAREIKRSLDEAKKQFSRYHLIARRKELFAELGRALYEIKSNDLPVEVKNFLQTSELNEIISDIEKVDNAISQTRVDKKLK